jgi:hypothetical protein
VFSKAITLPNKLTQFAQVIGIWLDFIDTIFNAAELPGNAAQLRILFLQ